MKWYLIHTRTGQEEKVKTYLKKVIQDEQIKDMIGDIVIPTEKVVSMKKSRQKIEERKFFPGYILINMEINPEAYWLVKNTPGVTGFSGGAKPVVLSEEEVKRILDLVNKEEGAKPKPAIIFEPGENIRIIAGPFSNFLGEIKEVDHSRRKIKVTISVFGRPTPVELNLLQVEKV